MSLVGAQPPRVLVVGGGYVGLYAALELERSLAAEEVEIELVSPENFMCYQPLLPEVASGSVEPRHVVLALRSVLRRTHVIAGELVGLDHDRRSATVHSAGEESRVLAYDHVVLGLGAVTKLLPVPGLVDRAVGFQTLTEAIHLRNQILSRLEVAETTEDPRIRQRALTFVFVGGGYAGVEGLAELEVLARRACRSYTRVSPEDLRWVLLEATDRILPNMDEGLAEAATALLRERGIEIRLETQLESAEEGRLQLSDGEQLESDTLVWMPGVSPHPLAAELGLPCDEQGRLEVARTLLVRGTSSVWSAGDCAAVPDGSGGFFLPTAQHAEREGRHIAKNIARVLAGKMPKPFRYRSRGEFVTLGDRRAIGNVLGKQMAGRGAWAIRRSYYLARMPSRRRRLHLLLDWTADLPFAADVVQLGTVSRPETPLEDTARERGGEGEQQEAS